MAEQLTAAQQREIVQRMIDAGETEENIATVIRSFKNQPQTQTEQHPVSTQPATPGFMSKAISTIAQAFPGTSFIEQVFPGAIASATEKAAQFAWQHPVQSGAMMGGLLAAPLTLGESIPAAMMISGLGAATGAAGGVGIKNVQQGTSWSPQDVADVAKEGFYNALPTGVAARVEQALVSPAARMFAQTGGAAASRATEVGAAARAATNKFTNDLVDSVLPVRSRRLIGNRAEAQQAISDTLPYIAPYFKTNPSALEPSAKGALTADTVNHFEKAYNWAISRIEQGIQKATEQLGKSQVEFAPSNAVLAGVRNIVRTDAPAAADNVLKLYKIVDANGQPVVKTFKQWDAIRKQLNDDMRDTLSRMDSPDMATALKSNPTFRAQSDLAAAIRDEQYSWLDRMGVPGVREWRQLESKLTSGRNAFADLSHMGQGGANINDPGWLTQGLDLAEQIPGKIGKAVSFVPRPKVSLNTALQTGMKKYLADAETKAFPFWPKTPIAGELPAPPIITPQTAANAEAMSGSVPFDYTAGAEPGTFTRQGYAVSDRPVIINPRQAPAPNMPPVVERGYGTPQARELGGQTRVPGGQFEPSPLTFGGRTAEPGVPFTTAAGERLGGPVVGSYDTIKVRYPDMPAPKLGGKYPVQFPDGSTKTFSNASAAKTARELVARWTQEFGK